MTHMIIAAIAAAALAQAPTSQEQDSTRSFQDKLARLQLEIASGVEDESYVEKVDGFIRAFREQIAKDASDPELVAGLADLEVRRISALAKIGKHDEARRAIEALRASAGGEGAVARAHGTALLNSRLIWTAEQLGVSTKLPEDKDLPTSPTLDRAIREAVAKGDANFIHDVGRLAVPTLTVMARATDGAPKDETSLDPLEWLLRLDPGAALPIAQALADTGDFLIKRRVALALPTTSFRELPALWATEADGRVIPAPGPVEPLILTLLDAPALQPSLLSKTLERLARIGWMTEPLNAIAADTLRSSHNVVESRFPGVRGLATLALQQSNTLLRSQAVRYFADQEDASPLEVYLASTDKSRLKETLPLFLPRKVQHTQPGMDWKSGPLRHFTPEIDADYERRLIQLWGSVDPGIGAQVVYRLRESIEEGESTLPLTAATTDRMAKTARGKTQRVELAKYASQLPGEQRFNVTLELLRSSGDDAELLAEEDELHDVRYKTVANGLIGADGAVTARILSAAWEQEDLVGVGFNDSLRESLWRHPDRFMEYVRWSRENNKADALKALAQANRGQNDGFRYGIRNVPLEMRLEIARLMAEFVGSRVLRNVPLQDATRQQLIQLIGDSSLPLIARGRLLARGRDEARGRSREQRTDAVSGTNDILLEALCSGAAVELSYEDIARLGGDPESFLEEVYLNEGLPRDQAARLVSLSYAPPVEGGRDWLGTMLLLYPERSWDSFAEMDSAALPNWLCHALFHSDRENRLVQLKRLLELRPENAWKVTQWIKRARDREQWEDVEIMETVLGLLRNEREFEEALDVTVSFMTDQAGEVLFRHSSLSMSPERRAKVMEAIQTLVDWRDAAESWSTGGSAERKRRKAIWQLVETASLPNNSEARRAALRGLGLLGAIEELPLLIEALSSEWVEVREAAREAIDRLNDK